MLKFNHGVFQIVHVAESGGMQMISNGQQCSDLPSLYRRIGFIQRPTFKVIHTLYRGIDIDIDIQMFGLQPKVATPKLRRAGMCLVHCYTCGLPHFSSYMVHMAQTQLLAKSCHTCGGHFVSHIFCGRHRGCLVLGLAMPHFIIQCCQICLRLGVVWLVGLFEL